MKRLLIALLSIALLATPVLGEFEGGGGGGSTIPGISSNVNGEYPHAGTLVIWIDDGFRWTVDDVDKAGHFTSPENDNSLMAIFQRINSDSALAGTPWEMEFVVGCNIYGSDADSIPGNGLQGYQGQVGNAVPDTNQSMFYNEVLELDGSGIVEIALHGANAMTMDPYSLDAPDKVEGPFGTIGPLFGTTQGMIVDGYKALVDTIGLPHLYSYMTNGHRIDQVGEYYLSQYFRNCRTGWIHNTGSTEYPAANGSVGSTLTQRGSVLQFTRGNYDIMNNWFWGYDLNMFRAYLPFTHSNRMYFPHLNPPNTGVAANNILAWKFIMSQLAACKGTAIITMHDQNLNPPGTPANTTVAVTTDNQGTVISPANGMEGLEIVFRAAAHYCRNGLLNRDSEPKLQVIAMDKAMNKRSSVAHLGGVINYIDNFKMNPDTCSFSPAGDAVADMPWGYPAAFAFDTGDAKNRDVWADSLWSYIPPDSADNAGDNFFGYFNATGCLVSYVSNVQDFHALPLVVNVIPGTVAHISCFANASHLPDAGGALDSLSAGFMDIKVIPFSHYHPDMSDTTDAWLNVIRASSEYVRVSEDLDGPAGTTNAFNWARVQGRWHSRDENANLRGAGYVGPWYETTTSNTDADMRWRPFWTEVDVPEDANFLYIEFIPSRQTGANTSSPGFALATACTLQVAGIEVQGIPR